MKLPSIEAVVAGARAAAVRFPMVVVAAAVATVAGFIVAGNGTGESFELRLMFTALLGLPLFLAIRLWGERRSWRRRSVAAADLIGLAGLGAFLAAWPIWSETVAFTRWFQLAVGLHLLVAVLPYLLVDEFNGFWQYNRSLLLRFLTAALFSLVLFLGLSVALLAVDNLLGLEVADESYARLWFLLAFLFNTWYFLAGVPDDFERLERSRDYPGLLKVFAQYILVPIVALYLVILTIYLVKILVTREWPSGWIGYLVSSVSVLGILALLLVHPVRDREENRWINTYARWFFLALIPSIAMLLMAVWKRIDQYGVTERRYFLVVLAVWLAAAATYYTVTRSKNIKLIPATLCAIAFLTFLGPWSAYSVSRASQVDRLAGLLETHEILVEGSVRPTSGAIPFEDRREVSAILRYLIETHGTESLQPWFGEPLARIDTIGGTAPADGRGRVDERARLLADHLGVAYVSRYQVPEAGHFNFFAQAEDRALTVSGFEHAYPDADLTGDTITAAGDTLQLVHDAANGVTRLMRGDLVLGEVDFEALLERIREHRGGTGRGLPREVLKIEVRTDWIEADVYIRRVYGDRTAEGTEISGAVADLLFRLRAPEVGREEGP